MSYRFCPDCKNNENEIVKAGDKLKVSKKRKSLSTTNRVWGSGMANVGRTKECNIVPQTHFGPIPGIEVGTTWAFRVQVKLMNLLIYIIVKCKIIFFRYLKLVFTVLQLVEYMVDLILVPLVLF